MRVFLVGVELKSRTATDVRESLAELEELAETAGTQIVGEGVQKIAVPVAATYIGPGKAEEFAAACKASDASMKPGELICRWCRSRASASVSPSVG